MFMIFTLDVMVEAVNNKFQKIYQSETSLLLKNRKVLKRIVLILNNKYQLCRLYA